jgi:hypothetical protein
MVRNTGMRNSRHNANDQYLGEHEYTVSDDRDVFITIDAYAECITPDLERRSKLKQVIETSFFCHWPKSVFR